MKIVLNIEKRHLIFFSLFLVLIGGIFVIAGTDPGRGANNIAKIGHEFLYVNQIKPFNLPGFIEIGKQGEGAAVKIWDSRGNYMVIGGSDIDRRFDFKVGGNTDILFFGEGANYKFKKFIVQANDIELKGNVKIDGTCEGCDGTNNERITFTGNDVNSSNIKIRNDRLSAITFCTEKGYIMIDYNAVGCGLEPAVRYYSTNRWMSGVCEINTLQAGYLSSVTCESDITPEEPEEIIAHQNSYEGWGNGNWEKTCPEGKNMIGLKQEYDNENKVTAKLICQ